MNKWLKISIIGLLIILLMLVRIFGDKLFYDPFINYFKNDYLYNNVPGYAALKLFFHIFLRYITNALISLAIIYVAFRNKRLIKFSVKFYVVAFIVLSIVYYGLLRAGMNNGYLFTFYVRRFLIHPVFILILLPAFYYQKRLVKQFEQS
jgi:exosortase F-associated protein